jgi:uncharacterized protein (DUF1919 family)
MKLPKEIADSIKRSILRARLNSRDFTVVSNNCWGSHIYQQLGRPYQTPFVGLFLAPECYVALVNRFRFYLQQPLRFRTRSRHEYVNAFRDHRKLNYPIGCLGNDIEIQFLHYESEAEAEQKWTRRLDRVNRDDSKLFFKFCDRDGCTTDQLVSFDTSNVANKVCFVARPMKNLQHSIWIPERNSEQVRDGLQLSRLSPKYFDAADWINGGSGDPCWWHPLRIA